MHTDVNIYIVRFHFATRRCFRDIVTFASGKLKLWGKFAPLPKYHCRWCKWIAVSLPALECLRALWQRGYFVLTSLKIRPAVYNNIVTKFPFPRIYILCLQQKTWFYVGSLECTYFKKFMRSCKILYQANYSGIKMLEIYRRAIFCNYVTLYGNINCIHDEICDKICLI